jgi:hypothetical protein
MGQRSCYCESLNFKRCFMPLRGDSLVTLLLPHNKG